jgi:DNA helicase-4
MDSFLSSDDFLDLEQGEHILFNQHELCERLLLPSIKKLKKARVYKQLLIARQEFTVKQQSFMSSIETHNNVVAEKKVQEAYALIGNVEGRRLDRQQMLSVVKEVKNHLIIAGAGTGKTTTIVGKVKFLLLKGIVKPNEILLLSFTNDSAAEMRERIKKEIGHRIEVSTFHKLGMNIIKQCDGEVPKITQIELRLFALEELLALMEKPEYLYRLSSFLLYYRVPARSEFEFSSEPEYVEYLQSNPPTTLNGQRVKSYGEMDIANFLSQNGISYEYEQPYHIDTRTSDHGQYRPDFFLPEYNIYIEYFGIDRDGKVPSYFKGKDGKSASVIYKESMEWKRQLHKKQNTTMIECFAYEKFSGDLLNNFVAKLKEHNVALTPRDPKEIISELVASRSSLLSGFAELTETVITLIKNNNYTIDQVRSRILPHSMTSDSDRAIIDLIEPIYDAYSQALKKKDEIDFNDMINISMQYLSDGKHVHSYKYVIVDEYQDISRSRFSLLKAMRESNPFSLFCVGDDWQSIYRFAGSDIGLILNFSKHWGATQISRIETTYRFTQALVDISSEFIMKNPNQLKKSIRGNDTERMFPLGEICGNSESDVVSIMADRLLTLPQNSSVFFIGRYNFDVDIIRNSSAFSLRFDNTTQQINIAFLRRADLKITFLTAHRSKGLQADYVFILNNKRSFLGFPSNIQDAHILDLLLDNSDRYPHSEERRLFYVAMTRAKIRATLLTTRGKESEFIRELRSAYDINMKKEREASICPRCGGRLVKRIGIHGEFIGCSNYASKGCKYTRPI